MYEVKTEMKIIPDGYESINRFFQTYVLNNYLELGVQLVGRWVNDDKTIITEIWGYIDENHYREFFEMRKKTIHYKNSLHEKLANDKWIISKKDMIIKPTGNYSIPRHKVATSVFVQNEKGETLLVRSLHRSDTLELPGGSLDYEEDFISGAIREVKEETGLDVDINGLVHISQNRTTGVICFVFHGEVIGGEIADCDGETIDVGFYPVNQHNIDQYLSREIMKERLLDSMKCEYKSLNIFKNRPYELLTRLN